MNDKTDVNFDDFLLLYFAYGIKADSPIELMRFKRFYVEDFGEECFWNDEEIRNIISQRCFLHEGKSYLISESKCTEILDEIEEIHNNGAVILYYRDLYEKREEWFYSLGIFSDEMLKSFLQKYAESIFCRKSYFAWSRDTENDLLRDYIKKVWGESVLHDYVELKECMEYVPLDKIRYALANNDCFVWNSAETYTYDEKFIISENEGMAIQEYIKKNIEQNDSISFDEMPLDTVFDENYELSESAIFTLVFSRLLSDKYIKNNRAIAKKETERNAFELVEQYCNSQRELTVDDLFNQWKMRTGTHRQAEPLDIAYSTMIRVDATRFVSVEQVEFNEPGIDRVLDSIIVGEAIGLKEVTSFALFPDCNFPWNLYLLESFCRRYSHTFKYMAVTTNSRNAGAIVRKECNYDYHTLLAQILATKNITLSEDDVMNYLYDSGYIAKHSYKYLSELIELATQLKEESRALALCTTMKKIALLACETEEDKTAVKDVTIEKLHDFGLLCKVGKELYPTHAFDLLTDNNNKAAKVQCALFKGTVRDIFIDKKEFKGPIYEQVDEAYQFVLRHINMGAEINGVYRKDVYELPISAIREMIANAVLHRSYLDKACVQVCIFDDRLEVLSPGLLYGGLDIETAKKGKSTCRNESIAEAFHYMRIVETWGTGLPRIINRCKEYGLPEPIFEEFGDGVKVTIFRKRTSYKKASDKKQGIKASDKKQGMKASDKKETIKTRENKKRIRDYLMTKGEAKAVDIAEHIGLSRERTRVLLLQMEDVLSHGSNKNRTYHLK